MKQPRHGRTIQLMTAKVYVDMDSVLCLGRIFTTGGAIEQWRGQVATSQRENSLGNFSGLTALQILHRIQNDLKKLRIEREQFS